MAQFLELLKEKQAAARVAQSVQTLRNNRAKGEGLPYIKIGRSVRYAPEDIEQFIRAHRIEPANADAR